MNEEKVGLVRAYTGIVLLTILFIAPNVNAVYPGESQTLDFSNDFITILNVTLSGNTSAIGIVVNETNITLSIPHDYVPSDILLNVTGVKDSRIITTPFLAGSGSSVKKAGISVVIAEVPKFIFINQTQNTTVNQIIAPEPATNETVVAPQTEESVSLWPWIVGAVVILGLIFWIVYVAWPRNAPIPEVHP